jgi:hypothetical protein
MKQKSIFLCAALCLLVNAVSAQTVSADSINALNNKNDKLQMAITINNQKVQLAKMQNQLFQQNYNVEKTAAASQKAASKNEDAATILNNDDQDKDKANTARKSARTAEKNSTRARNAQSKMSNLTEDISDLEKRIADNVQKLTVMGGLQYLQ